MTVTVSLNEFASSAGRELEPSDWLLIDQESPISTPRT
jgi:hypothetical protein